MKNLFFYTLIAVLFYACTSSENKEEQSTADVSTSDIATDQMELDEKANASDLLIEHHDKVKEALFFHIRGTIEGLDEYRIVKSEKISIKGNQFEYLLVTLPIEYVREYQEKTKVLEAYAYRNRANISDDDSIRILGRMIIDSVYYSGAEKIEGIKIYVEGDFINSYKSISPYAGAERLERGEPYIKNIIVNLSAPKIYSKDQYYLKARIQKLTDDDLAAFSKEDLGYLRNEIFARHGHTFKTEKMSNYFAKQDWYEAYVADATPWLNETEKWNAQYIKTFEN
ncbi:MAG: hypothetical protein ACI9XJ_001759 [Marivirga sp.]|jgi:hypothetical protein